MAEHLTRHFYPRSIFVDSAGVRQGQLDPFSVAAMAELGLDMSNHRPKTFDQLEDDYFDLIVTLAPEAHHKALDMANALAIDVEYWPTADPSLTTGSRDQIMEAYRAVRDGLATRIRARLET